MVIIKLPGKLTEDFITLIPRQRARIDELMNEGVILQYSLSLDRSLLWVIVSATTERKVLDIISTFPLIHFMNPTVYPLAFHHSHSIDFPKLIMN
jgi:muconolactone delta-isomerase